VLRCSVPLTAQALSRLTTRKSFRFARIPCRAAGEALFPSIDGLALRALEPLFARSQAGFPSPRTARPTSFRPTVYRMKPLRLGSTPPCWLQGALPL
jgi:hypothetical protein